MAKKKISAFTETTTLADADILPVVINPATIPASRKVTTANLRASLLGNAEAVTTLAEDGGVALADGTQITLEDLRTSLYAGLAVGLEDGTAQIAIGRVGSLAGEDNTGDYQIAIGRVAGKDNSGDMQVAIGRAAGYHNTGDYCTQLGYYAGYLNEGASSTQVGYQAGRSNTADRQTAIGYNAGLENTGARQTCVGEDCGLKNVGSNQTCIGENAGAYNRGNQQVAMGEEAGQCNLGVDCVAIGRHAMRGNAGYENTAVGNDTFDTFDLITESAKTFDHDDISVANQTIAISGHGFGAAESYVNLMFTAAGDGVPGMDDGELCLFYIVDADTLRLNHPQNTITATGSDDGHTLTPVTSYNNATALGYGAQPDASNQVVLGDANVTEVVSAGSFVTAAAQAFYMGDPDTDGTWRMVRSGNNLVLQRRESGEYATKSTISA